MAMPRKLKQMNLFNDGNSYQGQCGTVTLPKLTRKLEAWRGGGMDGSVKVDLGMGDDGIQIEWTIGGYDLIAIRQYGITSASGVPLRWAGAAQRDDTGEVMAIEVVVRGRHEEIDFGEAAPGEDTEQKVVTTCSYYKLVVNGREELEIDLLNMIFRVDGIDRYEEMRRAIGL